MTIEALVTIHDQALIDQCEAEGRFRLVAPYRYLFVGPRPVAWCERMIVARDHTPNVERYPQFYDFTGWWTVAHHHLIRTDNVLCLQYDHIPQAPLMPIVEGFLHDHPVAVFVAGHRHAQNFMLLIGGFEDAYRQGLEHVGAPPMESWPDFNEWPSTQGIAWRTESLIDFMAWVTPLFDFWHDNIWAGHLMERMVKAWLVTTGQTEGYLPALVVHEGRDCHGTCSLMAGRSDVFQERNATFGRVV